MSWGGVARPNPSSSSNIKSSFYFKIPGNVSAPTDLMVGWEAVSQGAGVAVQPGVGVSPDGVVSEQWLGHLAGDLQ